MKQEARIRAAIEKGEIRKVVIIDDAFDPPALSDEVAGEFLDLLEKEASAAVLKKAGVTPEEAKAARDAITASEYTADELQIVVSKLYAKYVEKFDDKFDPAGSFSVLKGDNLRRVRPLLLLLATCSKLTVTRIGSDASGVDFDALKPDVVFVDYYLDATLSPDGNPDEAQGQAARRGSLEMLRRVLLNKPGIGPSVMLMSSHSVRKEAHAFRREIREERKVFASRFHYLSKEELDEEDDGSIRVSGDAVDALLDIAQRHRFAGAVEEGLAQWKSGLDQAAATVWDLITELELKDFAYLARFRLAEEGQPLSSYLEWLFGEVLIDGIARSVKWGDQSFKTLDDGAFKNKPGSQIEGAFDGPTLHIAELYFRARVDARPTRQGTDLRTGDLYVHKDRPDELLATVTPECDLVLRRNKRSAKRLTVVSGILQAIDAPDSSIADFFMLDNKPLNIVWNAKDIRTIDYPDIGDDGYRLVGTLRPLYAYELQRRVLADLGRVGLAVAPAMAMTAQAKVVVRRDEGEPVELRLPMPDTASCAVIPKRGSSDKPRVIYHRSFASALLDALLTIPDKELDADAKTQVGSLKQPGNQMLFVDKLCRDGQLDGEEAFGILTTLQFVRRKGSIPWCQILVSHEKEAAETGLPEEDAPVAVEL
ncbi:hypothetical protein [Azospirillum isscasi]|uniref:Response receiver domain-containing protein n=1 Tax=Azospirillum isscasi TaxID=3053926 RepID=A0ABU0WEA2_9PROT|nr:hypothetical protein [Azospirillum isscasi]MDQ2102528.1 hypothetical protein [Azospirillum isscasi]